VLEQRAGGDAKQVSDLPTRERRGRCPEKELTGRSIQDDHGDWRAAQPALLTQSGQPPMVCLTDEIGVAQVEVLQVEISGQRDR
jgi:hypothetical protein